MPRLDCVINENVAVLMENGAFALFILFHPGGNLAAQESPPAGNCHISKAKKANVRGYRPLGAGRSWN